MGRIARVVIPDCPHHVIQRGNRRQVIFFSDDDKQLYLNLLNYNCQRDGVEIWCYCLMDNHVHLIAVPQKTESLAKALGKTHKKYSTMINIRNNWKGHLWQYRFNSYPLDEQHLFRAVKYIERNPVRACIVEKAEDYAWSSAKAHVFREPDKVLTEFYLCKEIGDWLAYLGEEDKEEDLITFRKHERTGRPLGDNEFIVKLEQITGRILRAKKVGRQRKNEEE